MIMHRLIGNKIIFGRVKKGQLVTRNIAKKGFCGMRSSSPASSIVSADSDVLRIPFQAILPRLAFIVKP